MTACSLRREPSVPLFASLLMLALGAVPPAQQGPTRPLVVQPAEYRSASGLRVLRVDPSERHGWGPASYRMELAGKLVWEGTHPFTLVDARVADDGTSAGYAIPERGGSKLWILMLGADGTGRTLQEIQRTAPASNGPPEPWVRRLRLSEDRFDVEVLASRGGSVWWSYRLPTGEARTDRPPETAADEAPVAPIASSLHTADPVLELALSTPRRIALEGFDSPERVPLRPLVDARDGVWMSELRGDAVNAFGPDGVLRFRCQPPSGLLRPYRPYRWLSVRSDGHLFAGVDEHILEFDQRGVFVEDREDDEPLRSSWLFPSEGDEPWVVRLWNLAHGAPVERGANGRWFRALGAASVGRDGSLAVIDEPQDWADDGDPTRYVQVIAPDGVARATLPLPEQCPTDGLAYDGDRFVLLGAGELWALRADGSCVGRARLPDALGRARDVFFAREGTEAWLFAPMDAAMWVFEARWR